MAKRQRKDRPRSVPPPPTASAAASNLPIYAVLVISVLVLFHQVLGFDFVDLDDYPYVVRNPHIAAGLTFETIAWAFTQSYEGYWVPLTWMSYAAEVHLFGIRAGVFHATNVAIHAASACLLFAAMNRMTGARLASASVAALFAIHPLHVESVAWIAERKDVLSTFFYFLTILAYARYVERPNRPAYLLVTAAFGCALMSKPMVVTLPLVLLLLDVWPLGRRAGDRVKDFASLPGGAMAIFVREKAPLFAMSLMVAALTIVVQERAGAVGSLEAVSPSMRITNAAISCVTYLGKMVWPAGLAALYPYPRELAILPAALAVLLLATISACVALTRHLAPYLLVGWTWYLVTLLPVLGFIQAGPQARADRYTYVAMTGISIMVVWGIRHLSRRLARRRALLLVSTGAALALLGAVTWQQTTSWRDTETLFRRAVEVTSGNYVAHNALGTALRQSGQTEEGVAHLRRAVALAPDYAEARSHLAEALLASGRPEDALVHAARAVDLQPSNAAFRVNLGSALFGLQRTAEAEAEYREALRLSPGDHNAHSGLGLTLHRLGDLEGARLALTEAIRLNPRYADAHLNLGTVLARMGRIGEAAGAFAEYSRLTPGAAEGHVGLGTLLAKEGRTSEAIAELSIAVRMRPADAGLHSNLAVTLASAGRLDEAIQHLSEAVRLRPDRPELRSNLDLALEMRAKRRQPRN